jgi:hypothetical protein
MSSKKYSRKPDYEGFRAREGQNLCSVAYTIGTELDEGIGFDIIRFTNRCKVLADNIRYARLPPIEERDEPGKVNVRTAKRIWRLKQTVRDRAWDFLLGDFDAFDNIHLQELLELFKSSKKLVKKCALLACFRRYSTEDGQLFESLKQAEKHHKSRKDLIYGWCYTLQTLLQLQHEYDDLKESNMEGRGKALLLQKQRFNLRNKPAEKVAKVIQRIGEWAKLPIDFFEWSDVDEHFSTPQKVCLICDTHTSDRWYSSITTPTLDGTTQTGFACAACFKQLGTKNKGAKV